MHVGTVQQAPHLHDCVFPVQRPVPQTVVGAVLGCVRQLAHHDRSRLPLMRRGYCQPLRAFCRSGGTCRPRQPAGHMCGEMAEWSKAPHSKCGVPVRVARVRIPISPPNNLGGLIWAVVMSKPQRRVSQNYPLATRLENLGSNNSPSTEFLQRWVHKSANGQPRIN